MVKNMAMLWLLGSGGPQSSQRTAWRDVEWTLLQTVMGVPWDGVSSQCPLTPHPRLEPHLPYEPVGQRKELVGGG